MCPNSIVGKGEKVYEDVSGQEICKGNLGYTNDMITRIKTELESNTLTIEQKMKLNNDLKNYNKDFVKYNNDCGSQRNSVLNKFRRLGKGVVNTLLYGHFESDDATKIYKDIL